MSQDRRPAYAELVAAVLALRPDVATDRFDALLAELVASDRLDPDAARELRWWQRESVRAVGDYLTETTPDLLARLEASQRTAATAAATAAAAWATATAPPVDLEPLLPEPTGTVAPSAPAPLAPMESARTSTAAPPPASRRGPDEVVVDLRGHDASSGPQPSLRAEVPSARRRLLLSSYLAQTPDELG